jgi:hypothetical protein
MRATLPTLGSGTRGSASLHVTTLILYAGTDLGPVKRLPRRRSKISVAVIYHNFTNRRWSWISESLHYTASGGTGALGRLVVKYRRII